MVHFCWGLEQDKKQEKDWAVHELGNRMQPYRESENTLQNSTKGGDLAFWTQGLSSSIHSFIHSFIQYVLNLYYIPSTMSQFPHL